MRLVRFTKMHGAGNDFVLVDDRDDAFPVENHLLLAAFAARRTGIGCEGVIFVRASDHADFKMSFFNPDGTEADLCGNGARCVAAFARAIGAAKNAMTFETRAGLVDAEVLGPGSVRVWMPEPKNRRFNLTATTADGRNVTGDSVTVGVPHFIVTCNSVAAADVVGLGRALRLAPCFAPEGTNVDFVEYHAPGRAVIRTYERGVETESGACGTGAVAAAVVGVEAKGMSLPLRLRTSLGYDLVVDGDWRGAHGTGFTLTGPVQKVFDGTIDLDTLAEVEG